MPRIYAEDGFIAPTIAQQIFTIGSAVAGGAAGLVLANSLAKVPKVSSEKVAFATTVSVLFTLGAALVLAKSIEGEPDVS